MKILVVDDQYSLRESIRMALKDKYSVITASGAREALQYLSEDHVELVLLDIKLPDIDGIKVMKEIKKRYPKIIIILMTAHAPYDTLKDALESGASGYIIKPFGRDELVEILNRVWEEKHNQTSEGRTI
jgi:two-component system response regulator HydG